jgi:hypothetical protein
MAQVVECFPSKPKAWVQTTVLSKLSGPKDKMMIIFPDAENTYGEI